MDYTEDQDNFNASTQPYKEKDTPRFLAVMLRNEYRMTSRYLALVDSKATIMIHLNSIIISGLIVFLKLVDYFSSAEIVVLTFFVATSVVSLTSAALAVRPIPLKKHHGEEALTDNNEHLFNAQNFGELTKSEYEAAFNTIIKDQNLIFKNISNELFLHNRVLLKKFKSLRYSYNIFLTGIAITALLFIISRLIIHF